MSSNVLFALVVMLAAGCLAGESSAKEKRGLIGSLAVAHAPIVAAPLSLGHASYGYHAAPLASYGYHAAPIASYGYGYHAAPAIAKISTIGYHAPVASIGYHAPLLSSYHHPIW